MTPDGIFGCGGGAYMASLAPGGSGKGSPDAPLCCPAGHGVPGTTPAAPHSNSNPEGSPRQTDPTGAFPRPREEGEVQCSGSPGALVPWCPGVCAPGLG